MLKKNKLISFDSREADKPLICFVLVMREPWLDMVQLTCGAYSTAFLGAQSFWLFRLSASLYNEFLIVYDLPQFPPGCMNQQLCL